MALKSEVTVLLSTFFLCFEILFAGGISLASIFRFLNCRLGGEADGDTMDWIGDSNTAGDVGGAGESGAAKERSHCTADWDTDTDAAAGGEGEAGGGEGEAGGGEAGATKDNSVDGWQYTADGMGPVVLGSGLLTRHCGSFFGRPLFLLTPRGLDLTSEVTSNNSVLYSMPTECLQSFAFIPRKQSQ